MYFWTFSGIQLRWRVPSLGHTGTIASFTKAPKELVLSVRRVSQAMASFWAEGCFVYRLSPMAWWYWLLIRLKPALGSQNMQMKGRPIWLGPLLRPRTQGPWNDPKASHGPFLAPKSYIGWEGQNTPFRNPVKTGEFLFSPYRLSFSGYAWTSLHRVSTKVGRMRNPLQFSSTAPDAHRERKMLTLPTDLSSKQQPFRVRLSFPFSCE